LDYGDGTLDWSDNPGFFRRGGVRLPPAAHAAPAAHACQGSILSFAHVLIAKPVPFLRDLRSKWI